MAGHHQQFEDELARMLPVRDGVVDAHTHLGLDEDGQSLDPEGLVAALDEVSPQARAVAFPLHDPERRPSYRLPNDRLLEWAAASEGRIVPYCRLDPADDPDPGGRAVPGARRARDQAASPRAGVRLRQRGERSHLRDCARRRRADPRPRRARDAADAPAGRAGAALPRGDARARAHSPGRSGHVRLGPARPPTCAVRHLLLRARRISSSCSPSCPAERIVFASDIPYGRTIRGLYVAMRAAATPVWTRRTARCWPGARWRRRSAAGRCPRRGPRGCRRERTVDGTLERIVAYLMMGFGAAIAGGERDARRAAEPVALARCVCRDPRREPGRAGPRADRRHPQRGGGPRDA